MSEGTIYIAFRYTNHYVQRRFSRPVADQARIFWLIPRPESDLLWCKRHQRSGSSQNIPQANMTSSTTNAYLILCPWVRSLGRHVCHTYSTVESWRPGSRGHIARNGVAARVKHTLVPVRSVTNDSYSVDWPLKGKLTHFVIDFARDWQLC